jgi:hypothetical protein
MTISCPYLYKFVSCCDGTEIYFCAGPSLSPTIYTGTYQYQSFIPLVGEGGTLFPWRCYEVTTIANESSTLPPIFQLPPAGILRAGYDCEDSQCQENCFRKVTFIPCCGGASVEFQYAEYNPSESLNFAFQYTGLNLFFNNEGLPLIPYGCYRIIAEPVTAGEYLNLAEGPDLAEVIFANKDCDVPPTAPIDKPCTPCTYYYELTNCADESDVFCTTSNLSPYINNLIEDASLWPTIQLVGYTGCYYVTQIISCDFPVLVTLQPDKPVFIGCTECQETLDVYYELLDCNNPSNPLIYTDTDLSEFIGKYIQLDGYDDTCFYVSIATAVTGVIDVTVVGIPYASCELCSTQKYLLEDCQGIQPDIITTTDLSGYGPTQILVLETCPDVCWSFQETDLSGDVEVNVISTFETCEECTTPPVTQCVSFTNKSGKEQEALVTGPDGVPVVLSVLPGTTSPKGCYFSWDIGTSLLTPVVYGDCVDNVCPEVPQPKRKVTPGYNTPACTPEYYEKVECNFSEWMYKDVLEQRYGISNCCPEELMKWEIKHEMLMLDSLINPDYTCQPPIDCGCSQPTTCNCSCNSGN